MVKTSLYKLNSINNYFDLALPGFKVWGTVWFTCFYEWLL